MCFWLENDKKLFVAIFQVHQFMFDKVRVTKFNVTGSNLQCKIWMSIIMLHVEDSETPDKPRFCPKTKMS